VTFSLAGFASVIRDGVILSGTGVVKIDGEMRVGGLQETITVTGETPVVDVQSTKREITLDNETMRALPSVRSYSHLLTTVSGLQTNVNDVNTGPVFAIFPVHGGRGDLANNNVTLLFNPTFAAGIAGWQSPTSYMNPRVYRLNAEFAW
jgi:hypothetical protein